MKILLQVNATANWGSTGRITEQINMLAQAHGWTTYIAYGRYSNPSTSQLIHVGSDINVYEHYAEHIIFDNDGLASRRATKQLIKKIKKIRPDIIHLHNIHDHWLNYRLLFDFLNTLDTPIVWTQHDCWSFTGGCGYYSSLECERWKIECTKDCPIRKRIPMRRFCNFAKKHYDLKKKLFSAAKKLTLVPVSQWLEGELKESFLQDKNVRTIYNGVDTSVFKPIGDISVTLKKYDLASENYVVGVATAWSERKGFADYCKLASKMPDKVKIVLIGLNAKQRKKAAQYGIIGIARTDNIGELVSLYNGASIVMNLSYQETFGLTTVEGFACGTPSIVYNATASPEIVTPETGIIVDPGDIDGVAMAVRQLLSKEKPIIACRDRAVKYFNKNDRYQEYIDLYEMLLEKD